MRPPAPPLVRPMPTVRLTGLRSASCPPVIGPGDSRPVPAPARGRDREPGPGRRHRRARRLCCSSRAGLGQRAPLTRPKRSNTRISAADRATWPRPTPCRAQRRIIDAPPLSQWLRPAAPARAAGALARAAAYPDQRHPHRADRRGRSPHRDADLHHPGRARREHQLAGRSPAAVAGRGAVARRHRRHAGDGRGGNRADHPAAADHGPQPAPAHAGKQPR